MKYVSSYLNDCGSKLCKGLINYKIVESFRDFYLQFGEKSSIIKSYKNTIYEVEHGCKL